MNETMETWSLPWHTLQRNLALGAGAAAPGTSLPLLKSVSVRGFAVSTKSWLSRVQRPPVP
jgi:hypothetical protein